jgi:hypothetical protein
MGPQVTTMVEMVERPYVRPPAINLCHTGKDTKRPFPPKILQIKQAEMKKITKAEHQRFLVPSRRLATPAPPRSGLT